MILLEFCKQVGLCPKWKANTGGGEYASACPLCGGHDRFIIQPLRSMNKCKGSYFCRKCGMHGDTIQFCRDFLDLSYAEAADRAQATDIFQKITASDIKKHATALQMPPDEWLFRAQFFVMECHRNIMSRPDILEYLTKRGLPIEAVIKYNIGWNPETIYHTKNLWGLFDDGRELWFPRGIVIPTINSCGKVVRLKIRRVEWVEGDSLPKYAAIPGSMNGCIIIGNTKNEVMIVVESEFDAYAIHFAVGDFAFVIAVGGNTKEPDNVTDYYARKSKYLLLCHDNDEGGEKMFDKWQRRYRHARSYQTPIGKDIGEAIKQKFDIRNWLLSAVKIETI